MEIPLAPKNPEASLAVLAARMARSNLLIRSRFKYGDSAFSSACCSRSIPV